MKESLPQFINPAEDNKQGIARRSFLKKAAILTASALLTPKELLASADNEVSENYNHQFYGKLRPSKYPHDKEFAEGPYWLEKFDPRELNSLKNPTGEKLASQLLPINNEINQYYNAEQVSSIKKPNLDIAIAPYNTNADLGLQYKLRQMRSHGIISKKEGENEKPEFIILSHGHAIAGLVELSKMRTDNGDYLFDVAPHMPLGTWTSNANRAKGMASQANLWGSELEKTKNDNKNKKWLGGIAIGLNGHRGDFDYDKIDEKAANINPKNIFGEIEKFEKYLISKGIKRIVVITEHTVKDYQKDNYLTLKQLIDSDCVTFDEANKDLYSYLQQISDRGKVEVVVISGDTRKGKN